MNIHTTTIHARCPYVPEWDYYRLTFETGGLLQCEKLQEICNGVRGQTLTQEAVFERVADGLSGVAVGKLTLVGQHGNNGGLTICEMIPSIHDSPKCSECGSNEISLPTSSDPDGVCADCGAVQ
jgi:hypothetical protein